MAGNFVADTHFGHKVIINHNDIYKGLNTVIYPYFRVHTRKYGEMGVLLSS